MLRALLDAKSTTGGHGLSILVEPSTSPTLALQMAALKKLVGTSQIVFGTDFPFGRSAAIAAGLQESGIFTPEELRAIDHDNAYRILPKYKS